MVSQEIVNAISTQIKGVSPDKINLLIEAMNSTHSFFRGVRYQLEWEEASYDGDYARGSDGCNASYWTSGERVFNASGPDHFQAYDTTFFHYSTGIKDSSPRMYMLATDSHRTPGYFIPDSFIQVHEKLEKNQYDRLQVIGKPNQELSSLYPAMIRELQNFVGL